jgi:branched-chain amino acid transport system substrate-binding protein
VPGSPDEVDGQLYNLAILKYGDGLDPASAGTVSFRGLMNLWSVLRGIGADEVSPASVIAALREAEEAPSFNGHPYTCATEQVPGLPALCAPQQVLVQLREGTLVQISDGWIDVPGVLSDR